MSLSALLILMAAIGCVVSRDGCGPLQRIKVMVEFGACERRAMVADTGGPIITGIPETRASGLLWLFALAPEAEALFGYDGGVVTTRLRAQGSRFLNALKYLVGFLDMDGVLQELLAHLRAQHAGRDLKPEYFKIMNTLMVRGAENCVPWPFDEQAWTACYTLIVEGISGLQIEA